MKNELDFFPPIYWFFLIPIYFLFGEIIGLSFYSFFYSTGLFKFTDAAELRLVMEEIVGAILSVSIFFLYKKFENRTSLKQVPGKIQLIFFLISFFVLIILFFIDTFSKNELIGVINYLKRESNYITINDIVYKIKASTTERFYILCFVFL